MDQSREFYIDEPCPKCQGEGIEDDLKDVYDPLVGGPDGFRNV